MFDWLKSWITRPEEVPDPLFNTTLAFLLHMNGVSFQGRCACGAVFPLNIHELADNHGKGASLRSITPELICLFCEKKRVVPYVHRY